MQRLVVGGAPAAYRDDERERHMLSDDDMRGRTCAMAEGDALAMLRFDTDVSIVVGYGGQS